MDQADKEAFEKIVIKYNGRMLRQMITDVKAKYYNDQHKVDMTTEKYKILLKLINQILTNLNKPNVNDLREFKNIKREMIILDIHEQSFKALEKEIFKHFEKKQCNWYGRKNLQHYILTFLRCACKDIGLQFVYERKNIMKNSVVQTKLTYKII